MLRLIVIAVIFVIPSFGAETFSVATYNVENYLGVAAPGRELKSEQSRAKVHEYILSFRPDVLAVQEIGSRTDMSDLQAALKKGGLDLRFASFADGPDPHLNLAVLSRFPITAERHHTNENYLLRGKRFRSSRGFAEIDIRVNERYAFTLLSAHLKSKRFSAQADESEMREQEALLLREKVDGIYKREPRVNLIVLGDMNDDRSTKTVRTIMGRGQTSLLDLRPSERNGDERRAGSESLNDRAIVWTHHFIRDDTYSRADYIFVSPGMMKEWHREGTFIPTRTNWGLASDHRPVVAQFEAVDK